MLQHSNVCPRDPIAKDKFQQLLRQAWSRVTSAADMTHLRMASKMGVSDPKTISRALACSSLPEAHTVFNSLLADPTALNEVLREYGYQLALINPNAANDMETLSGLCETAAELSEALRDGIRKHPETLRVAEKLRPHMPALEGLIHEADELRRKV